MKVVSRHVIDDGATESQGKSPCFTPDIRYARRLHSERAYPRAAARNFVNDRQGYRTVKGGGRVSLDIEYARIPFLAQAEALAEAGYVTGASGRNWASYGEGVVLPPGLPAWQRTLLTDPQTSGGLLVACAAERAHSIRDAIEAAGYPRTQIIGSVTSGDPVIRIT